MTELPFGFVVNLVARQLERHMSEILRPLRISPAAIPILLTLGAGQPRTQADLARALNLRQPTLNQTLARVERDDLIRRQPHGSDRRAAEIHLTDKGWRLVPEVRRLVDEFLDWALQDLPAERRDLLIRDLLTVSNRLDCAPQSTPQAKGPSCSP